MSVADPAHRAGRYVRQSGGYRAFLPASLPPYPPVRLEGELQALLSRADRALGRLDGSIQTLPHPDLFVAMYVRKEAVLSSQIEGTQSSLEDVLTAEACGIRSMSITDSGASRSLVPVEADHRFRCKPITDPAEADRFSA
ncbi:MAG: hypothetical protein IT518_00640, partial [Burkholderiales bacterium]|nr:hypothetical protein [Burkholderiales bacterium]